MNAQPAETWAEKLARWSDPEPRPCRYCDTEGVVWLVGGGTEPCPECQGAGCFDDGF